MGERMLTMRDVVARTTFSKTHIYRLIGAGEFPKQVKIGPRRVAFVEREVEAWMRDRTEAREVDHA